MKHSEVLKVLLDSLGYIARDNLEMARPPGWVSADETNWKHFLQVANFAFDLAELPRWGYWGGVEYPVKIAQAIDMVTIWLASALQEESQ